MKKGMVTSEVVVLLHDIRSTHNVGSMFRTSDAFGVAKIFLSGYSPTPLDRFGRARKDIAKVSLGAEKSVAWEYVADPYVLIRKLKKEGCTVVALEQDARSVPLSKMKRPKKMLFVVGNEVGGVNKKILDLADTIVELPMRGKKESLNVSVAFGVGLFGLLG